MLTRQLLVINIGEPFGRAVLVSTARRRSALVIGWSLVTLLLRPLLLVAFMMRALLMSGSAAQSHVYALYFCTASLAGLCWWLLEAQRNAGRN